jgi:hypothetical protein
MPPYHPPMSDEARFSGTPAPAIRSWPDRKPDSRVLAVHGSADEVCCAPRVEPAREQIADRVLGAKRRREFLKYLDKLRAQAIIEWKNEDIKKAYEEGLNRQAAAGSAPTTPSH